MTYSKNVDLTSAIIRPTNNSGACNSISKNGDLIYITYSLFYESNKISDIAAELFHNNGGRLLTINKIKVDNKFQTINGGFASNNFHRFTLLDSTNSICRLRLFDKNFNLLTSKLFKDYYSVGSSFKGGNFSEDGKYISLTYVYDCNIGKNYQKSIIRILDADNLNEIASFKYDGNTPANTKFFKLKDKNCKETTYLMFSSIGGKFDINNSHPRPPALLKLFELNSTKNPYTLEMIQEVELPQSFRYDCIKSSNESIYILIGTDRTNIRGQIVICNKPKESFIDNDCNEFRIYKFKKDKLKLIIKNSYGLDLNVKFYPKGRIIALMKSNDLNNIVNVLEFFKLDKKLQSKEYLNDPIILPSKSEINFSDDGKWMIVTGKSENYFQNPNLIKNVLLFKIESQEN